MSTLTIEASILLSALDSDTWGEVSHVEAEHFSTGTNATIWRSIQSIYAANQPIDALVLCDRLERDTGKDGWLVVINELVDGTVSLKNPKSYADMLIGKAQCRKGAAIASNLAQELQKGETSAIDKAISELLSVAMPERKYMHTMQESLTDAINLAEKYSTIQGGVSGISSGLNDLDQATAGWQNGELIVIGARPAMGKTALAVNAILAADQQVPVMFFSGEQASDQIGLRNIVSQGGANFGRLRSGKANDQDWSASLSAVSALMDSRTMIYDKPAPSLADVQRVARSAYHTNGVRMIVIDYLQRMKTDDSLGKAYGVGANARGLKELARELNIPVIVLAQVNRSVETRGGPNGARAGAADLKDSGEIEQEADLIITLYRESVYNADCPQEQKELLELIICKNRNGELARIRTHFDGSRMRIRDIDWARMQSAC